MTVIKHTPSEWYTLLLVLAVVVMNSAGKKIVTRSQQNCRLLLTSVMCAGVTITMLVLLSLV
jgi:4-hydroxybenzoate polyprenyltransferase